ncbi:hypothetical protein L211DRAFT_528165 [Terfezia boudieri ATCC MYA-4762]|uniref:Uncharacterized protein n=1 Tax=Terfezia boudieri ATCC MYA-4762 TaxID=1051890 RepID=A0A3N4LF55_9PEZI|nr:hypothetical protein L211DRAFT_528165 [Terfezia boudieri ATCC MYA-4762]
MPNSWISTYVQRRITDFWVLLEHPPPLPDVSLLFVYMSTIYCVVPQAFLPSNKFL